MTIMAKQNEFVTHIIESLVAWAPVTARSMFGGYGIYREDRMFALIAYDTLYFKVDEASRPEFESIGLAPFTYGENRMVMAYYHPPVTALDDPQELAVWAEKGWQAAMRAAVKPKKKTAKQPKKTT
ncbi:MAG: transcriptional regulator [Verrucomicrobia bacterium]|nr:transcriptional regulator [Verrucomicrobiota bacterium]